MRAQHEAKLLTVSQTRDIVRRRVESSVPIPSSPHKKTSETEGDSTEDDEDLDALPKSQSQSKGQTIQETIRERSLTPEHHSPPKTASSPVQKAKVSSFRIGGKSTRVESPQPLPGSIDAEQERVCAFFANDPISHDTKESP